MRRNLLFSCAYPNRNQACENLVDETAAAPSSMQAGRGDSGEIFFCRLLLFVDTEQTKPRHGDPHSSGCCSVWR